MKYVTLDGLQDFMFEDAYDALSEKYDYDDLNKMLDGAEARMLAYIIPNTPRCDDQIDAFCKAVYAQVQYENEQRNTELNDMPDGITSFSVNGFSASFGSGSSAGTMVSSVGLCKEAKARLLYAGLLYRGVMGC